MQDRGPVQRGGISMIIRAKSNMSAVNAFRIAVSNATEYSSKFERGFSFLDELFRQLSESADTLGNDIVEMSSAQQTLEEKKKDIEAILAKLTTQLNSLTEELSEIESQMANISSTITITDEEGNIFEVSNPAYVALAANASAVEAQIDAVRDEMLPHQTRLEHVNSVASRLASHADAVHGVIYSLEEKKITCRQLQADLEEIQRRNLSQGTVAAGALKKIEDIIAAYLRIKMTYENVLPSGADRGSERPSVNINLSFTKIVNNQTNTANKIPEVTKEEIVKHKVEFDATGRISSYDGKTFGGSYNTYDVRLGRTLAENNPVLGRYEGIRGESKFVPSERSVEGIVVKRILSEYGINGIEYRNAEPDFEVCAEAVVRISAMTEYRENYMSTDDEMVLGNFAQADIELAKAWNLGSREGRDNWKPRDVYNYRKANNLTWHEKCDMETMVLVRYEINLFFKHSGGCSECRMRDAGEAVGGEFDE